jgi:hypothetical protein
MLNEKSGHWQNLRESVQEATDIRVTYEPPPEVIAAQDAEEEARRGEFRGCFAGPYIPPVLYGTLVAIASSGVTAFALQLLKLWVDSRKDRKLKIKVDDIEDEATQMNDKDVLRIFEMLEEKADRKKIRELLLCASKAEGRAEAH